MKVPVTPEEIAHHKEWQRKSSEDRLRAGGRAITSEEKRAVVERLLKVWEQFPELRFGQLLDNRDLVTGTSNLFYAEDMILCNAVEEFAKKQGK